MATHSAYKVVDASLKSIGVGAPLNTVEFDSTALTALQMTYTVGTDVTPNAATELTAKRAYLSRVGKADTSLYLGPWSRVSAGVHAWVDNNTAGAALAVAHFLKGRLSTSRIVRVTYNDATDVLVTKAQGFDQTYDFASLMLSTCHVAEEVI